MVINSDLPWVTEMSMPLIHDVFLFDQLVLFESIYPVDGDGFDYIIIENDRLAFNYTNQGVHQTTGTSNIDGAPPLSLRTTVR